VLRRIKRRKTYSSDRAKPSWLTAREFLLNELPQLPMGGYGLYVWVSFGITPAIVLIEVRQLRARWLAAVAEVVREIARGRGAFRVHGLVAKHDENYMLPEACMRSNRRTKRRRRSRSL
jgi:heme exporter protein CcmD